LRGDPLAKAEQALAGMRIVVTRTLERSQELVSELAREGAQVFVLPAVAFAPPEDWRLLDEELRRLDGFDSLLFLSTNAVRYLYQRSCELGIKCHMLPPTQQFVAAVGPATAAAAEEVGIRVDYVAKSHTAESLVRELGESVKGRKVLVPRSDRGDERLAAALREAGAELTEVVAYRTAVPQKFDAQLLALLQRAEVDAIVFASPSAYHNLKGVIGPGEMAELSSRVDFAAIGPTTARALRDSGARVAIEANESSAAGLADAIAKYYRRQLSDSAAKGAATSRER
jgi:uroporphyrinogen-III synthase